jgi:hypothetical protein
MLIALLIAGIGFLLAGLLGIALGIPVKEFSFGNTEILGGVITACTGAILLGLWMAIRELREIAQELAFGAAAMPRAALPQSDTGSAPHDHAAENDGLLFNQPGAANPAEAEPAPPSAPPTPPPWHEETASRDRVRGDPPPALPASAVEAAPAPKQRRNLLFSSTSRKERERAEAPAPGNTGEPPATFEEAWPQSERARPPEALIRRSARPASTAAEANAGPIVDRPADRPPPAVRNEDPPAVTMLKSGIVDGMAYSLYSDGSIEAQMPEGMMRFASIDELRAYLDQRG